jgi:integrase
VRPVRLHDARHSAATTLLALGVPVRVVADLLGHAQTRITQDTYQHVLPALAQEAADRMGAELWGS